MITRNIEKDRRSIKITPFFSEEKPNLHLIVAGSLLEAKMPVKWSVPVGRLEYMYLYPNDLF